jgi:hypothetical protein
MSKTINGAFFMDIALAAFNNISQTRRITLKSKRKGEKERKETGRMLTRKKGRTKETFRTTEKHICKIYKQKNDKEEFLNIHRC